MANYKELYERCITDLNISKDKKYYISEEKMIAFIKELLYSLPRTNYGENYESLKIKEYSDDLPILRDENVSELSCVVNIIDYIIRNHLLYVPKIYGGIVYTFRGETNALFIIDFENKRPDFLVIDIDEIMQKIINAHKFVPDLEITIHHNKWMMFPIFAGFMIAVMKYL